MIPTLAATTARVNFGSVLRRVQNKDPRIFIEKDGVPTAVVMGIDWYEDMMDSMELLSAKREAENAGDVGVPYTTYFAHRA
jgi:prevent-host-death family protein